METTRKAEAVVVEKSYNAPVTKVWEALTDNAKMKQWYFNIPEFKPEVGFEFQFSAGDRNVTYLHLCVVKEVLPFKKLAYSWRYDGYPGDSLVTFELFEEGTGSRVRVTHTGFETFPAAETFAPANFNKGWTHILNNGLKNFVDKE